VGLLSFRTNIAALRVSRRLSQTVDENFTISRKLSSGQRINTAADDAAGLSIASSLRADVRIYQQALKNINDGISSLRIAQGSLEELSEITNRKSELAEQAANGTYSNRQRLALDKEARSLTDEYNRILQTSSFNQISLFGTDMIEEGLFIQAGYGYQGIIGLSIGKELSQRFSDGTYQSGPAINTGGSITFDVIAADMNGDGITDLITNDNGASTAGIQLGNGDGTFGSRATFATSGGGVDVAIGDINNDGFLDVVSAEDGQNGGLGLEGISPDFVTIGFGNGAGGFQSTSQINMAGDLERITLADINGDGNLDILASGGSVSDLRLFYNNGGGIFSSSQTINIGGGVRPREIAVGDFNNDGLQDMAVALDLANSVPVYLQNQNGTFTRNNISTGQSSYGIASSDLNNDGNLDLLVTYSGAGQFAPLMNQGNGSFSIGTPVAVGANPRSIAAIDVNGDSFIDAVTGNVAGNSISVALGGGNGTFQSANSFAGAASPRNIGYADINGDGVPEIVTANSGGGTVGVFNAVNNNYSPLITPFDLRTQIAARSSFVGIQSLRQRISKELGSIGAFENRLEIAFANLRTSSENYSRAESRISDVDMAETTADLVSNSIRQQTASRTLNQALKSPELALILLNQ
jgi:flagellin-like hook-associated protein FlgL